MDNDIKVKCKHCGRPARSSEFRLDPDLRMMVCPACIHDKQQPVKKEPVKPAGWDAEDEYLAKRASQRAKPAVEVISDSKVRLKCQKCGYSITYNVDKQAPANCPYCGMPVPRNL